MTRHRYRAHDYVEHMLQACARVLEYVQGQDEAAFLSQTMLHDAVIRHLSILGEASGQLLEVLPEAPSRFPQIPFRTIYATRNRLIHGYVETNLSLIWEMTQSDVPPLHEALQQVLAHWPSDLS